MERNRRWRIVYKENTYKSTAPVDSCNTKHLVESGVRAPGEETVELEFAKASVPIARGQIDVIYLDQQEQVRVLALGGGTVALLDVVLFDIDTLEAHTAFIPGAGTSSVAACSPSCSCRDLRFGVV